MKERGAVSNWNTNTQRPQADLNRDRTHRQRNETNSSIHEEACWFKHVALVNWSRPPPVKQQDWVKSLYTTPEANRPQKPNSNMASSDFLTPHANRATSSLRRTILCQHGYTRPQTPLPTRQSIKLVPVSNFMY